MSKEIHGCRLINRNLATKSWKSNCKSWRREEAVDVPRGLQGLLDFRPSPSNTESFFFVFGGAPQGSLLGGLAVGEMRVNISLRICGSPCEDVRSAPPAISNKANVCLSVSPSIDEGLVSRLNYPRPAVIDRKGISILSIRPTLLLSLHIVTTSSPPLSSKSLLPKIFATAGHAWRGKPHQHVY